MAAALAATVLLAACGGGGGDGGSSGPTLLARGSLLEEPRVIATVTAASVDATAAARGWQAAAGPALCDVRVVALDYRTPGAAGEASNASGVLLLPAGACAGQNHPLVAYGRSTEVHRPRTLANAADAETQLLMAMYAARGYAVVSSDYLGFAQSAHAFHPYLHADSEATTLVDAIRAARNAAPRLNATLSGTVMLTGYSQGAHASLAAQRAIEQAHAAEINLAAAAHLGGPYNLSGLLARGDAIVGYQYFVPFLVTSWQKVYGDVYREVNDVFRMPYAGYIGSLLPHATHTFVTLRTSGTLPGSDVTAAEARDLLLQPSFLAAVRSDASHPLLQAARRNDLGGWAPRTRTLLCGGAGDPTVSPALHQDVVLADFRRRGAAGVTAVDVDAQIQALYGPGGRAPTDPASAAYEAYFSAYHTDLEPPLCHAQARALFDALR